MKGGYDFRAQFYDLEFTDNSDKQLLTSLITDDVTTILEVPCGSGRNLWLAETGKAACFADLSPNMVNRVQQKLDERGLINARAVVADVTKLGEGQFDLIIIAREGIQLLSGTQIRQAFTSLAESLTENGQLYVDFAKLDSPSSGQSNLPEYVKTKGDTFTLDMEFNFQGKRLRRFHKSQLRDNKLYVDFKYEMEGDEGQPYMTSLVLTNYRLEEVRHIASECGLMLYDVFGGYNGTSYTEESERFVVIFKKDEQ